MIRPFDYSLLVFVASLLLLLLSAWMGVHLVRRRWQPSEASGSSFGLVLSATLTLMALIVGFSFSMAVSRYDLRKNLEEAEANAIGTEFKRVDLLPPGDAARARELLKLYYEQRLLFYTTRDSERLHEVDKRTTQLEDELWSVVIPATSSPSASVALAVSGMNDVLNSQGYTQAAWLNRIPAGAWALMVVFACASCLLLGAGVPSTRAERPLTRVLPVVIAFAFLLIADIDSPRRGVIRVTPDNLQSIASMFETR